MFQLVIEAAVSGAAIAILALSFQVAYLPSRVFFLGLAGIYALAPYVALEVRSSTAALPEWASWATAVLAALLAGAATAVLLEWANHARLARRGASGGVQLVASLGTFMVLVQVIVLIWGTQSRSLLGPGRPAPVWHPLGASLPAPKLIIFLVFISVLFIAWRVKATDLGLRLRAMADNPEQFALFGYSADRLRMSAFALSGLLAGAAALATAYDQNFSPYSGLPALLLAVVAVLLGGQGSFSAPIFGAMLLGAGRAYVAYEGWPQWQDAMTFGLLAVVLLAFPHGLLGKTPRLEASL